MNDLPELLKRSDVLRELSIGRRTLRGLINAGRLKPRKFHEAGRAVFLRSEVMVIKREVMGK